MTIKEIERLTGMTRANIRFYEEKGLLSPARQENGYREYTQAEVETLKRVALLRMLEVPLEEIRALQMGQKTLDGTLCACLAAWEKQQAKAVYAQTVCRAMQADQASYDTLDAEKYLHALPEKLAQPPQEDRAPYPYYALRRFCARALDMTLYQLLWWMALTLIFRANMAARGGLELLDTAVVLLLTYALEPWLLHLLGTTPGKWLFGLWLEGEDGRRPTAAEARERTRMVLWRGLGLMLPIYGLVRLWKSAQACAECEKTSWDEESTLIYTIRDSKPWRYAAAAGALAGVVFAEILCAQQAALPPHRGEMTVAEFADNYNHMLAYYQSAGMRLDESAQWVEEERGVVIRLGGAGSTPVWQFETDENGHVQEIAFEVLFETPPEEIIGGIKTTALYAALAYIGAQPHRGLWNDIPQRIARQLHEGELLTAAEFDLQGVHVVYRVEQHGYVEESGRDFLWSDGTAEPYLHVAFSMTKK